MILFPESVSLFFRQKLKDDLSQKQNKTKKQKKRKRNMIFFKNVLKRWSFQNNCTETSFLYYLER